MHGLVDDGPRIESLLEAIGTPPRRTTKPPVLSRSEELSRRDLLKAQYEVLATHQSPLSVPDRTIEVSLERTYFVTRAVASFYRPVRDGPALLRFPSTEVLGYSHLVPPGQVRSQISVGFDLATESGLDYESNPEFERTQRLHPRRSRISEKSLSIHRRRLAAASKKRGSDG
jgi:hypothetical protein